MRRFRSSSPISGNLVLMTDTRDAKMGVKVGEAIWDFIRLRQNRPLPRSRFCTHAHSCQAPLHQSRSAGVFLLILQIVSAGAQAGCFL